MYNCVRKEGTMLGKYLKKYRLNNNLSQVEMAALLKTSQAYYSQIESDNRKPGIQLIRRISKLLKVEPSFVRGLL